MLWTVYHLKKGVFRVEFFWWKRGGGAYLNVNGAQFGATRLPVLAKNGAGPFTTVEAIHLTDKPPGVSQGIVLTLTRSGNNVIVGWTPAGGTLESTPSLNGTPTWTPMGTANPATIPVGAGNLFIRVRQ